MPPRPCAHAADVPAVLPVHVLAVHQIQFTIRVPDIPVVCRAGYVVVQTAQKTVWFSLSQFVVLLSRYAWFDHHLLQGSLPRLSSTAAGAVQSVDIPVRGGLHGFLPEQKLTQRTVEQLVDSSSGCTQDFHLGQGSTASFSGPADEAFTFSPAKKSAKVGVRSKSELAAHSSSSIPGAYGVVSSLEDRVQEEKKEEHEDVYVPDSIERAQLCDDKGKTCSGTDAPALDADGAKYSCLGWCRHRRHESKGASASHQCEHPRRVRARGPCDGCVWLHFGESTDAENGQWQAVSEDSTKKIETNPSAPMRRDSPFRLVFCLWPRDHSSTSNTGDRKRVRRKELM